MSHFIFIFNIFSFFTCIFALCIGLATIRTAHAKFTYFLRLLVILSISLLIFSQVAERYLQNMRIRNFDWVNETQEIAMVFLLPSLLLYVNKALNIRTKKLINMGISILGLFLFFLYIYGNFINIGFWEFGYMIYGNGLVLTIIHFALSLIIRKNAPVGIHEKIRRSIGGITLLLCIALIYSEFGTLLPGLHSLPYPLDVLPIPVLCLIWSTAFIGTDLAALIDTKSNGRPFDIDGISATYHLSKRESEVMDLLLKGKRYHEIGEALFISKATVKTYIFRLYKKFEVSSKMELVNKIV